MTNEQHFDPTTATLAEIQRRYRVDWSNACRIKEDVAALRAPQGWQPIESAPKMRTVLMFAVTDIGDDGRVNNWKMATGHLTEGRAGRNNETDVQWDGHQLKVYDHQPTHWQPLPLPPVSPVSEK